MSTTIVLKKNIGDIMNDNIYEITVKHNEDEELRIGDVVATTTSHLPFNGVTHCFEQCDTRTVIVGEHVGEDYEDYNPRLCGDGGCYGYDYFKIISIE